jgi:transposase InsO family protein
MMDAKTLIIHKPDWSRHHGKNSASNHSPPVAENFLKQNFAAETPNQVWLTDIAYIPTDEGWLCLAGHKDICTGEISAAP